MIRSAKICLSAAAPLVLTILAGCASQIPVIEAATTQGFSVGEAGCLKTRGPLIRTDIIDLKTIVLWDLEGTIYRVGTRDTCLVTTDIKKIRSLAIARALPKKEIKAFLEICANKHDSVRSKYFVPQVRSQRMNCLITSVAVIDAAEYEALTMPTTGEVESAPSNQGE